MFGMPCNGSRYRSYLPGAILKTYAGCPATAAGTPPGRVTSSFPPLCFHFNGSLVPRRVTMVDFSAFGIVIDSVSPGQPKLWAYTVSPLLVKKRVLPSLCVFQGRVP